MVKKRLNIWDKLAWVVLGLILLWLILKVTGIINTPLLVTYAPYFGAVYIAGWQINKLSSVSENVKELKKFRHETIKEIHELKLNCIKKHK